MRRNPPYKWLLIIQPAAQHAFDKLQTGHKRAIFRHLIELLTADDPCALLFVEMLKEKKFERIRKFRVGNYRVRFAVEAVQVTRFGHTYKGTLFLLDIRDRKEAY